MLVRNEYAGECNRYVVTIFGAKRFFVGCDGRCILTMRDHRHRTIGKDFIQGLWIIDQQVAGRRAHEHLDAACLMGVQCAYLIDVVVTGAEIERIIGP